MLVVEGPDGAGKSSLVQHLAKLSHWPVAEKAVGGDAKATTSLKRYIENSLDEGFTNKIYDRHALISSPIYTSALRRSTKPQEGFDDYIWLSTVYARWRDLAPLVVICLPPFETVWQNCQRDENNKRLFPEKLKLASVYWAYFNLAARNPAYFLYDYTKGSVELELVERFIDVSLYNREKA